MRIISRTAFVLLVLVTLATAGCKTTGLNSKQKKRQFAKMSWITGSWEYKSPEYQMYEEWRKINDTLFEGRSTMIISSDTAFTEKLSITGGGINVFYNTSTVNEMYNTRSSYLLTFSKGKKMTFSNPDNKEQSQITYQRKKANLMTIRIEGLEDGKTVVEQYSLRRSQ